MIDPSSRATRVEAKTFDGVELQLVVLVEVLQELLVDRVQVCEEEIVHGSILTHHDGTRSVHVGPDTGRAVPVTTQALLTISSMRSRVD